MKKLFLPLVALSLIVVGTINPANAKPATEKTIVSGDWMKSKDGTWMGKDKMWYKINTKDATVWMSKDGKEWAAAKDNMWQDKDGKWLKVLDAKTLKWSADGGKTWADVPEWKWEGPDGTWYKFDSDWNLWTMKSDKK